MIGVCVTGNAILLARSADGIARAQPLTVGVAALAPESVRRDSLEQRARTLRLEARRSLTLTGDIH